MSLKAERFLPSKNISVWLNNLKDGSSPEKAATSAKSIKDLTSTNANGVYWINLSSVGPTRIFCLMDDVYDGGGWMMMMKATTGTTFQWSSSHWTTNTTLNTQEFNQMNNDAKFDTMNYFPAKDMMALWPDIGQGGSIKNIGNWIWLENNFYAGERIVPITFWNTVDRYFIRDAKTFSGWQSGVFSSQVDVRFYGFNFRNNPGWGRTRWGFGWNENGGGLYPNGNMDSDDVSGGIGMHTNFQNWSAGDRINCCQDTTGINRSARVEVYIR